jgi:predicted RNA-binding protein with PIN domain
VTNDFAERETVISLGSVACSCENFIQMIDDTLGDMQGDMAVHNKRERKGFKRGG